MRVGDEEGEDVEMKREKEMEWRRMGRWEGEDGEWGKERKMKREKIKKR